MCTLENLEQALATAADFKAVVLAVGASHAAGAAGALPAIAAQGLAVGQHAAVGAGEAVAYAAHLSVAGAGDGEIAAPIEFAIARFGADWTIGLWNLEFHYAGGMVVHTVDVAAGAAEKFDVGMGGAGCEQDGCGDKGQDTHGVTPLEWLGGKDFSAKSDVFSALWKIAFLKSPLPCLLLFSKPIFQTYQNIIEAT